MGQPPDAILDEVGRVTRPGGRLILAMPLNWRQADGAQWSAIGDLEGLRGAVERRGFETELAFDGPVYREILDLRGSATDWRVAVVSARRRS